jgi:YidC/Oxa1 family membrane protein insertase
MDRRTLLAVLLIMAVLIGDQYLMSRWGRHKQPAQQPTTGQDSTSVSTSPGVMPPQPSTGQPAASVPPKPAGGTAAIVSTGRPRVPAAPTVERELKNAHANATFSSRGGTISQWILPKYPDLAHGKAPVNLVPPGQRALQIIVTTPYFTYDFTDVPFRVAPAAAMDTSVTFIAEDSSGVRVSKTYRMGPNSVALDLEVRITVPPQYGPIQYRWGWARALPITETNPNPRLNEAVALVGDKLEALDPPKIKKEGAKALKGNVRWAGDRSKYFVAALVPDSATVEDAQFTALEDGQPTVWLLGAAPPGTEVVRRARLYAGPIHYDTLVGLGAELDRLANQGSWRWIAGLSALLLSCLNFLHRHIPNYGVAIILISLATKLVFYPLTQSSLRSMKLMHHLQPEVKAIQDKYKNDPGKMNQAMMALYKQNKVNPMSGCLPMLLQIPVFFALYNVLLNSIELRGAGFVGYIQDLAVPDVLMRIAGFPIHVLPIIMTGSTYLMQSQTPVAPQQKTMMMLMPAMMLVFMYSFPSGVIIYWTVNNILSAIQQYFVNQAEDRKMAAGG